MLISTSMSAEPTVRTRTPRPVDGRARPRTTASARVPRTISKACYRTAPACPERCETSAAPLLSMPAGGDTTSELVNNTAKATAARRGTRRLTFFGLSRQRRVGRGSLARRAADALCDGGQFGR